ncbi:MAG: PilX N-terminal domain-containing pilus assembly protein [Paraglaciecola polaris]|uniref:PilX N-terminal domain-containing pilus assembly protein n=1 Tax=Paraglaciecola polaris TaxID=222814 RepID=UPI003002F616
MSTLQSNVNRFGVKQRGLVMVFALLVLVSLTVLGIASVSSGLLQNKMAVSLQTQTLAFDAAEAAIAGVVFESEDNIVISDLVMVDPLTQARQAPALDIQNQTLRCQEDGSWTNRRVTSAGLTSGAQHQGEGHYDTSPAIDSWSRTAYIREQACLGSSNVISGSHITCHVFIIKGCGQMQGSSSIVANSLTAAVLAPASQ